MSEYFSIAIDGPAGAGKSTVAKRLAQELGALYLDTGAMYRAVGLYMLRHGIDPKDADSVCAHAAEAVVDVAYVDGAQRVYLCGDDVTDAIRVNEVSAAASAVSAVPLVRRILVARQREIAQKSSVVMDGRDIGTAVLPDATVKVFLTASAEIRASRRFNELKDKGQAVSYAQILDEIRARDHADSTRAASPMVRAEDAALVDCSDMTVDQVVASIKALLNDKVGSV